MHTHHDAFTSMLYPSAHKITTMQEEDKYYREHTVTMPRLTGVFSSLLHTLAVVKPMLALHRWPHL